MSREIIILSEDFGIGHKSAANVIERALKSLVPESSIVQYNPTSQVFPTMLACAKYAYFFTLRHFPKVWGSIYYKTNGKAVNTRGRNMVDFVTEQLAKKQLGRTFDLQGTDVVICTHPFAQELAAIAYRDKDHVLMITVVTDYSAHRLWIADRTNMYFVADESIRQQFISLGVTPEKIIVTGMPIDPKFYHPKARKTADGQQVLLVLGGGMGINIDYKMVSMLAKRLRETKIVIVCGKNRKLYEQLQPIMEEYANLQVLGFVNHMDQLLDQADAVLTKPGGITIAECIAKQVPMILTNPIPGQEEDNINFLLAKQAGIFIRNFDTEGMEHLIAVLNNPDYLRTIASNMQGLITNGAAEACAQMIVEMTKKKMVV